jgi:hypothetical protein
MRVLSGTAILGCAVFARLRNDCPFGINSPSAHRNIVIPSPPRREESALSFTLHLSVYVIPTVAERSRQHSTAPQSME